MNKQELIEIIIKNIDDIGAYALGVDALLAQGILGLRNQVNGLKEKLDEPSREECRLIANEYNVCSCCDYNMNSLIKEIVVGCDTEDFCDCGRAAVHQVFWTDKYMNYCPNCGSKIKRNVKEQKE